VEQIIQNIKSLVGDDFSEDFCNSMLNRLQSFGYEVKENDIMSLCFAMQKVGNHINNSCNTTSVPDELFHIAVDMSCGEFLFAKKQTGQLEIADLDLTGAITSISEGDTSVSFASDSTDESRFNDLLNYLMTKGEGEFVCYRKIKW
jgi:hypothetical protein